jgi:hypothetical protein
LYDFAWRDIAALTDIDAAIKREREGLDFQRIRFPELGPTL